MLRDPLGHQINFMFTLPNYPMSEKVSQNERHLCLVSWWRYTPNFQRKYILSIHKSREIDMPGVIAAYGMSLGYAFWEVSLIVYNHLCLNCCIFTKLSHTVCLINTHNLLYLNAICEKIEWMLKNNYIKKILLKLFTRVLHDNKH